ncbi:bacteriocin [Alteromonas sediminis]|uniref:bacteriocin n=1 Tax=Alteromonas sediminis TaxID=2259342 RepID=UPI0014048B17|nr:bacteriocin [Alteromonas sediminis]
MKDTERHYLEQLSEKELTQVVGGAANPVLPLPYEASSYPDQPKRPPYLKENLK